MRRATCIVAALALVPAAAIAQQPRDTTISISVSRTVRVAPDRASFFLLVEGNAELAADAVTRVSAKVAALQQALKAFPGRVELEAPVPMGVAQTANQGGYPMPAATPSFSARAVIRVQLSGIEHLTAFIAAATTAGAIGTSSIIFESTAADSIRRARLPEAIAAARADAEAIAKALGGRVGGVLSVNSNFTGNPYGQQSLINFDMRHSQNNSVPEVFVPVNASVSFLLRRSP